MKKLKTFISSLVISCLALSFMIVVIWHLNDNMADKIASTFLTLSTSIIGSFVGYQAGKETNKNE